MEIKPGAMKRLNNVISICKTVFYYGWVPFVIYLGYRKNADPYEPRFTIIDIFWPFK